MIDTDKYEGHTVNRRDKLGTFKGTDIFVWDWFAQQLPVWASKADTQLIADAPLLLEEVKRLREELDGREAYIKRLSEQLVRATKWAYQQVCHNDSAMMDFDDYVWGEE